MIEYKLKKEERKQLTLPVILLTFNHLMLLAAIMLLLTHTGKSFFKIEYALMVVILPAIEVITLLYILVMKIKKKPVGSTKTWLYAFFSFILMAIAFMRVILGMW